MMEECLEHTKVLRDSVLMLAEELGEEPPSEVEMMDRLLLTHRRQNDEMLARDRGQS